jgi:hypothetical protein
MPCDPSVFEEIPIFSLLDADERAVLAEQVELRTFRARHRIYKPGDPGGKAYVVLTGRVQVIVIDDDHQEVVIDSPGHGEMFGLASMLAAAPHQTLALATEDTIAIRSSGPTSPGCCSASRWPASTCSRWSGASSTPPRTWCACAPPATPTR